MATENKTTKESTVVQIATAPLPAELPKSNAPTHYRFLRVSDTDFAEDGTAQVAISSEYPGEQRATEVEEKLGIAKRGEKFVEVLSHRAEDVDLTRLNDRAAFLDEHKDNRHIGSVQKAMLSEDNVARAVVKFDGASKLSKTRQKQMRSGSRPHISLGYAHTRYLGAETLKDGRTGHRFAWIGLEVSSVAVPMDPTVGKGRSGEECRCLRCGGLFARDLLDADYLCEDCVEAETPSEDGSEARGQKPETRLKRFAEEKLPRVDEARTFRAKSKNGESEISFNDLKAKVCSAADSDKRFKTKRENGNVYSDFWVYDVVVTDGGDFKAVIVGPECKMYEVTFTFDGSVATLGDAVQVEAVTSYQPVERSAHSPQPTAHSRSAVDSREISEAQHHTKNFMPKTAAELATEFPEVVTSIRTEQERATRATVLAEVKNKSDADSQKVTTRNQEIHALADEMVKSHGLNWNGKPGAVYVVGEKLRTLEAEICAKGADFDSAELRRDFKRRADEFITGSRAPKNPEQAADLPAELANRCSLGRVIREGIKAADRGQRSNCFMIADGAEFEAHREIHKNAREFPGGSDILPEGIQLPWNMPSGVRSSTPVGRLKRDALAGDFASAGALIQPQYVFPTIELLRNFPALARAGMTILSGVMGNLVLPRQESPTTAQSIAEGGALAQYDQVLGQIKMSPHRVGSSQKYSRLALLQTTPDFEAMIMADHMAVMALKIDALGLNGQGAGDEPLGVLNQLIPVVAFGGSAANAYKNAVALETAVRKTNIYEPGAYITTSTARGTLKSTAKVLTGATTVVATAVWEDGDTINGRRAWDSQQVPNDLLVHGVFRHLVMAQWGGLAIVLDTISQANQDKYWLNINTYIDFALRHNSAISKSADSLASLT